MEVKGPLWFLSIYLRAPLKQRKRSLNWGDISVYGSEGAFVIYVNLYERVVMKDCLIICTWGLWVRANEGGVSFDQARKCFKEAVKQCLSLMMDYCNVKLLCYYTARLVASQTYKHQHTVFDFVQIICLRIKISGSLVTGSYSENRWKVFEICCLFIKRGDPVAHVLHKSFSHEQLCHYTNSLLNMCFQCNRWSISSRTLLSSIVCHSLLHGGLKAPSEYLRTVLLYPLHGKCSHFTQFAAISPPYLYLST